eukprot:COSAG01_NODE_7189_length_3312_cov_12.845005_1_plen_247_part_00
MSGSLDPCPLPSLACVLTASDFTTDISTLSSRLGFSCQLPSEGVPVPVPTRAPAIGAVPRRSGPRPSKRPRQDLLGRCFLVRWGDVCDLWPQWEYCDRHRIPWRVLAYDSSTDRFQCQYRGASAANRALIGNGGVREFALDHRFKSLESLRDLLPSVPKFPYHQIAARRFRCYEQQGQPAIARASEISKFTEHSRCPHCQTPLFDKEKSAMCCSNGKFVLPRGRPNPPELEQLLNTRDFPKYAILA